MSEAAPAFTVRALAETVAVVTGGTSGIGLECAAQLAEAGVPRIVVNGRSSERGTAALETLRARAPDSDIRFVGADMTRPEEADRLMAETVAAFGRIDLLVNSAGGNDLPALFHELSGADLERIVHEGLVWVLQSCRAALPHMTAQRGGAIVNVASDAAKVATPGETVIGAVMAAIVMFSRTLAMEAKRGGVRVNCVTPSIVRDTPLYDRLMADAFAGRLFAKAERMAHLGVVTPGDLAGLVVYLAGPAAARLTGQAISLNGGISAA
ncbi:MAG: SDR family NAD(P)-dependent oxidoreductase [Rhodospirillales bacterium]|nr:SDR family NAD(P)-dependent oxidoreductase [Rhodospirillales bacterium]